MSGKESSNKYLHIYSKKDNYYKLDKIIIKDFYNIYQFSINRLLLSSDEEIYLYSTENYRLIKYKKDKMGIWPRFCDTYDKYIIIYSYNIRGGVLYGCFICLMDKNTLENISKYETFYIINSINLNHNGKIYMDTDTINELKILNKSLVVGEFIDIDEGKYKENIRFNESYHFKNGNIFIKDSKIGLFYLNEI